MGRVTAITGSSTLANLFFGVAAYYAMASYYGWNQAAPSPHVVSGATATLSGAHPAIVIFILLACAVVSSVPAWIIAYRSQANPTEQPRLNLIVIQSPTGGRVPLFKIVRGFAYPPPALVQVLILAGPANDKRWFPQPDAEISRYEWTAKCRFGDASAPVTGWDFDCCAVIPRTRINETVKDIPADAIVSQIIHVFLDRTIPNEDFS